MMTRAEKAVTFIVGTTMAGGIKFEAIPYGDDVMTLKEFKEHVEDGALIDYDGHGYLATKEQISNVKIHPSKAPTFEYPDWCTHIVWYNR